MLPSIKLIKGVCRHCYYDKNLLKRFSAENKMDPGDIPEELQELTDCFSILSSWGQHAYRGNVINFPQDALEIATRHPRNPSLLDILIVHRQSTNSLSFSDFNVRRTKSCTKWIY